MDTELVTLSKIFTERLFRIPDYQRGYAWREKQLREFWSDLEQLEIDRSHYTGVLTLELVPNNLHKRWANDAWIIDAKGYQPYFVVDGQQRLTTAIILIQVILEHVEENQKINYTELADIRRKFIFDSKDNEISRSYIFGYEDRDPSYQFLKSVIFKERVSGSVDDTVYTQNLEFAKTFFSERVSLLSHEQLEILYRKVTQNLLFNIFSISKEVDVCVAFETMNNRGRPLSYLELLKNRLIYLSLKFDDAPHERDTLRQSINDCWRVIYHNLGRNKEQPLDDDYFLITHYIIYFGRLGSEERDRFRYRRLRSITQAASSLLEGIFTTKNVRKDAPEDVRVTLKNVYDYANSLEDCIQTWYYMFNPFHSPYGLETQIWLDKLNRIDAETFHPLILIFLKNVSDEQSRAAFLQGLERLLFVLALVDRYNLGVSFEPNLAGIKLAVDFSSGEINAERCIRQITDWTNEIVRDGSFTRAVRERFKSGTFYQWESLRYFLFEYNLYLQSRSKTERVKIYWPEFNERRSDFVSVEHIFPQRARHEYWSKRFGGLAPKVRSAVRDSLGNLLPLSRQKNSSLSNRSFPEKVDGRVDEYVGYRFGSYAENEVAKLKEWTPDEVTRRGLKLLSFMERRWSINLGNSDEKMALLGLDSLHKEAEANAIVEASSAPTHSSLGMAQSDDIH